MAGGAEGTDGPLRTVGGGNRTSLIDAGGRSVGRGAVRSGRFPYDELGFEDQMRRADHRALELPRQ